MSTVELIPEVLAATEPYAENNGVYWYAQEDLNVRELARAMNAIRARFVTITAYQLPKEEGFRLEYHWDLAGRLLGFGFTLRGNSIESIYDLLEAADWIEREIHEGFAIDFIGREYEPLLLKPGDTMGVNMREVGAPAGGSLAGKQEVAK